MLHVRHPRGYTGLMEAMADTIGVDLSAAMQTTALTPLAAYYMMQHCAACADSDRCRRLLASRPQLGEGPPAYCVNRKMLLFLRDQLARPEPAGDSLF